MSYHTEFERLIITSSLVGFDRQAISNVAGDAAVCFLSNALEYEPPSHLRFVG